MINFDILIGGVAMKQFNLSSYHYKLHCLLVKWNVEVKQVDFAELGIYDVYGASIMDGGKKTIIVDQNLDKYQTNFTIAHELGHIVLGHVDLQKNKNIMHLSLDDFWENQADEFALQLLVPQQILSSLLEMKYSYQYIANFFEVPEIQVARRIRQIRTNYLAPDIFQIAEMA